MGKVCNLNYRSMTLKAEEDIFSSMPMRLGPIIHRWNAENIVFCIQMDT